MSTEIKIHAQYIFAAIVTFLVILSVVLLHSASNMLADTESVPASGKYTFVNANVENILYIDFAHNTYKQNIYLENKLELRNSGVIEYWNYTNEARLCGVCLYNDKGRREKLDARILVSDAELVLKDNKSIIFRK